MLTTAERAGKPDRYIDSIAGHYLLWLTSIASKKGGNEKARMSELMGVRLS